MQTFQVNILNPKAAKLLQELADFNLISVKQTYEDFLKAVFRLRSRTADNPPYLNEITKEVEAVRAKRYVKSRR
jgi:hypothetical protein